MSEENTPKEEQLSQQDQVDAVSDFLRENPMFVSPQTGKAYNEPIPTDEIKPVDIQLNEATRYSNAIRIATTTTDTKHGGYPSVTIPKGTKVSVEPASNLPDSSPIDYLLVYALDIDPKLNNAIKIIRDGHGIGFRSSDLKFNR